MTEFFDPGVNSAPAAGAATAGSLLRQAREASGLHIAALAVALKVPVKKIEALEADRLDLLPDAVFARGLTGSICRHLKIDPQLILPLLPQSGLPRLPAYQGTGLNTPFRSSGVGSRAPAWTQVSRPAVIAGLAFVVGAALLFLLPKAQDKKEEADVSVVTPVSPAPLAEAPAPAPQTALAPADLPTGSVMPVTTVSSGLTPPAPAAVTSVTPVAAPASAKPAASSDLVSFSASKPSWVEVMDGRGTVVLRRQLAAGEVAGISGVTPLKVVVGRADALSVQVRGQAMDLAPVSKDNVARFEVK